MNLTNAGISNAQNVSVNSSTFQTGGVIYNVNPNLDAGGLRESPLVGHLQSSKLDDERQRIASWLSSLNFKAVQNEYIQKRENGTGEWLLESPEFKDWRDGTSETLWCPGDGK